MGNSTLYKHHHRVSNPYFVTNEHDTIVLFVCLFVCLLVCLFVLFCLFACYQYNGWKYRILDKTKSSFLTNWILPTVSPVFPKNPPLCTMIFTVESSSPKYTDSIQKITGKTQQIKTYKCYYFRHVFVLFVCLFILSCLVLFCLFVSLYFVLFVCLQFFFSAELNIQSFYMSGLKHMGPHNPPYFFSPHTTQTMPHTYRALC